MNPQPSSGRKFPWLMSCSSKCFPSLEVVEAIIPWLWPEIVALDLWTEFENFETYVGGKC